MRAFHVRDLQESFYSNTLRDFRLIYPLSEASLSQLMEGRGQLSIDSSLGYRQSNKIVGNNIIIGVRILSPCYDSTNIQKKIFLSK